MTPETQRYYEPSTPIIWQGRRDGPNALRYHEVVRLADLRLNLPPASQTAFALIGFACDVGIMRNQGRPGAASGPRSLRQALGNRAWHCSDSVQLYDLGDITCNDGNLERAQTALAEVVAIATQAHMLPIVLGGGHETAWGHFQGLIAHQPKQHIGVVNIDSHFDMRPLLEGGLGSSGTSFTQIAAERQANQMPFDYLCIGIQPLGNTEALFDKAKELHVEIIQADIMLQQGVASAITAIDRQLQRCKGIYVSLDLDVFNAAYAPGVSAPQPLGLPHWLVTPLLQHLAHSGKVIGFDVVELSPAYDLDGRTSGLASAMMATFISEKAKTY